MIRQAATAGVLLCGLATPSWATEWVSCAAQDGAASFDYLAGTLDELGIVGMTITVGEQVWASDPAYGPGDPVLLGQAFETAEMILVDAVNPQMTATVAELRLFKADEADVVARGGTLRVPGHGAWVVSCSGP